ncbi:flavodoxin family protein [Chloroflexota bacterium]
MRVQILGISGTPVKDGNCDKLVQASLQAAEEIDGVETEFITLADKEIAMCQHCQYCIVNKTDCKIKDDAQPIFEKMKQADGIIIGAPTWLRTVAPPILILLSRARSIMFRTYEFRNKVAGAITVSWFGRGMDMAALEILLIESRFMMIPVVQGMATSSAVAFGRRAEYMEHGALDDVGGMVSVRGVGYRVAEVARMIKYATDAGIVVPPEYQVTTSGGTIKRKSRE